MADIFISYARDDKPKAQALAKALECDDLTVWWDSRLHAGQSWDQEIERELSAAKCVVVLWSNNSVERRWVRGEANDGLERGILVPVLIDKIRPPLAFRLVQTVDLSDWTGANEDPAFQNLLSSVKQITVAPAHGDGKASTHHGATAHTAPAARPPQNGWGTRSWLVAGCILAAVGTSAGLGVWFGEKHTDLGTVSTLELVETAERGATPEAAQVKHQPDHSTATDEITTELIIEVQQQLTERGLFSGAVDGIPGHKTRAAVEAYERQAGLRVDGEITPTLVTSLRGAGSAAAEGADYPRTAGQVFRDCAVCPDMVVVPAGTFMMGSPANDDKAFDDERPQRLVTIEKKFAIGVFEVTFAAWDACVEDGGCNGYRPDDKGWGREEFPVINVNWNDAKAFVRWLSRKTGQSYRLPSEVEWEYAARAGTSTRFWWGDRIDQGQANCNGCGSPWDNRQTAPVGRFYANGFGLKDTVGNVWEWVEDEGHDTYHGAPTDGRAWVNGGQSDSRVLRGGSWVNDPRYARSANRSQGFLGFREHYVGFRVARDL